MTEFEDFRHHCSFGQHLSATVAELAMHQDNDAIRKAAKRFLEAKTNLENVLKINNVKFKG